MTARRPALNADHGGHGAAGPIPPTQGTNVSMNDSGARSPGHGVHSEVARVGAAAIEDARRAAVLAQAAEVRDRFQGIVQLVRATLDDEPSANLVWAAARNLNRTINMLAEQVAGERR